MQDEIRATQGPVDLKVLEVLISLSCTMYPELVTAAQRIAAANRNVSAEVYDLKHFHGLKDRHQVMSVPCLVIDNKKVSFGKKHPAVA